MNDDFTFDFELSPNTLILIDKLIEYYPTDMNWMMMIKEQSNDDMANYLLSTLYINYHIYAVQEGMTYTKEDTELFQASICGFQCFANIPILITDYRIVTAMSGLTMDLILTCELASYLGKRVPPEDIQRLIPAQKTTLSMILDLLSILHKTFKNGKSFLHENLFISVGNYLQNLYYLTIYSPMALIKTRMELETIIKNLQYYQNNTDDNLFIEPYRTLN